MRQYVVNSILVVFVLCGCRTSLHDQARDERFVADAVQNSKAFHELARDVKRIAYMIEQKDSAYFTVAVGESTLERFRRMATLRIERRTGAVYRETVDELGEEIWVKDR